MSGLLSAIEAQPGNRIAVRVGDRAIDYARLNADIGATASLFVRAGIDQSTTIGIRAGPLANGQTYASWIAHLAAIRLGCRHVTMVETVSIADTLGSGLIDLVVGSEKTLDRVPLTTPRLLFNPTLDRPVAPDGPTPPNREHSARRLNLTSGTTGKPKFLEWTTDMMGRRVAQVGEGLELGPQTEHYNLLHLRTTSGFRYPIAVWMAGGTVLLPEDETPRDRDHHALHRSTLICCSPPMLENRLKAHAGEWPGRDQRTILVLGGRLARETRRDATERACKALLISYGSTETGGVATGDSALLDRHPGAVGFLRKDVEVVIVDEQGNPVPPGTPGAMRIRSPLMTQGYASDGGDSSANDHFRDGYFLPGDRGILFEDGMLAIEGRESDTFNIGGWKVNAHDLESKLGFLPGVIDLCSFVMPLDDGDLLTFAIACQDDADLDRIAGLIKARIPRGTRFHVVRLKAIPRNEMGKAPRTQIAKRLTELYGARKANLSNA